MHAHTQTTSKKPHHTTHTRARTYMAVAKKKHVYVKIFKKTNRAKESKMYALIKIAHQIY